MDKLVLVAMGVCGTVFGSLCVWNGHDGVVIGAVFSLLGSLATLAIVGKTEEE